MFRLLFAARALGLVIIIPLLAACLALGCARQLQTQTPSAPSASASGQSRQSQRQSLPALPRDDLDRAVVLKKTVRRLVVIGPGAVETVFALGAGDRLVGRDSAADHPPAALKVPVAGDGGGPFFERVVAARPDLVIVQGETWGRSRVEEWQRKCGAPVAALAATSIEEVARGMEKIGAWLGVRDKARTLARTLAFTPRSVGRGQLRVFFEVARSPLWTAGRGTLIDDALRAAALRNVAAGVRGYTQFNLEQLVARQPSLYIVTRPGASAPRGEELQKLRREAQRQLLQMPGLKGLQCVQQATIVIVPADWILRPGPRLGLGVREMNRQAYAVTNDE